MRKIIRPLRGGQITIPAEFRKKLGIDKDTLLSMDLKDQELKIKPLRVTERLEGSLWFKELYDLFEPVRKEAKRFSEKEIDDSINKALKSTRQKHA